MHTLNKLAMGNLLSTISIVLLTIIATSLIGVYTNQVLNQASLSPQLSCIEMQSSSLLKIQRACYNVQSKDIEATLKRSIKDTFLPSLTFTTDSNSWFCSDSCGNCEILEIGNTKTYFLASERTNSLAVHVDGCVLDSREITDC
jgi:hypothetical protein